MSDMSGYSDFFYMSEDGLRLHACVYGDGGGKRLPVVCLPGLTRNARDFHELALFLAKEGGLARQVVSFDYRGRGLSDRAADAASYTVAQEARDVVAGLSALGISRAQFIGTSRGGLILHVLAATNPDMLDAIVLNDIGPEIAIEGLLQIKSYLLNAVPPKTFAEALAFQKSVHGEAFTALSENDWNRFVHAIYRDEAGIPAPDYDPRLSESLRTLTAETPLPTLWAQFDAMAHLPLMVIRGENSRLLTTQIVAEMLARHPNLEILTVIGQGHAPLVETGEVPKRIASFLGDWREAK